ncbi:DUF4351 domain-containing protein [Aquaspirillum sp. LM1]|uniref:DUF4351 domain-containing protein n=1 Tax=Aquaspirillum sp. LM1 TaxID=1938604 RepID=UPI001C0C4125|nr:DUF4351 domain-containing protein [Aquaspirillum sp. LM1]
MTWIRAVLLRQSKHTLVLPKVRDLKELKMTLAERFDQWAQQHEQRGKLVGWKEGRQEGRLEGRLEGEQTGEARLLQRLLTRRFGALPADCVARIRAASPEQLERWSDRVLDAHSLTEVFQ